MGNALSCRGVVFMMFYCIVLYSHRAIWAVSNHDFIEAFGCQAAAVSAFTKALQAMKDENWALPIMFVLCIDLRLFALSVSKLLLYII